LRNAATSGSPRGPSRPATRPAFGPRRRRRSAVCGANAGGRAAPRGGWRGNCWRSFARRLALWPPGFAGSLAHDDAHALAAVARAEKVAALGVDLEPDAPLARDLAELVATPAERARYDDVLLRRPILFVIKEAVFKALFPADRRFLDFHDIEVDLETGRARTRLGGRCSFAWQSGAKIVALAAREV
jgi:4'-phosphopantetheinyl transferase EntD